LTKKFCSMLNIKMSYVLLNLTWIAPCLAILCLKNFLKRRFLISESFYFTDFASYFHSLLNLRLITLLDFSNYLDFQDNNILCFIA